MLDSPLLALFCFFSSTAAGLCTAFEGEGAGETAEMLPLAVPKGACDGIGEVIGKAAEGDSPFALVDSRATAPRDSAAGRCGSTTEDERGTMLDSLPLQSDTPAFASSGTCLAFGGKAATDGGAGQGVFGTPEALEVASGGVAMLDSGAKGRTAMQEVRRTEVGGRRRTGTQTKSGCAVQNTQSG